MLGSRLLHLRGTESQPGTAKSPLAPLRATEGRPQFYKTRRSHPCDESRSRSAPHREGCQPGLVDVLGRKIPKDWQILADEVPVLIRLLPKRHRAVATKVLHMKPDACIEMHGGQNAHETRNVLGIGIMIRHGHARQERLRKTVQDTTHVGRGMHIEVVMQQFSSGGPSSSSMARN